jgi:hypothetical protein
VDGVGVIAVVLENEALGVDVPWVAALVTFPLAIAEIELVVPKIVEARFGAVMIRVFDLVFSLSGSLESAARCGGWDTFRLDCGGAAGKVRALCGTEDSFLIWLRLGEDGAVVIFAWEVCFALPAFCGKEELLTGVFGRGDAEGKSWDWIRLTAVADWYDGNAGAAGRETVPLAHMGTRAVGCVEEDSRIEEDISAKDFVALCVGRGRIGVRWEDSEPVLAGLVVTDSCALSVVTWDCTITFVDSMKIFSGGFGLQCEVFWSLRSLAEEVRLSPSDAPPTTKWPT